MDKEDILNLWFQFNQVQEHLAKLQQYIQRLEHDYTTQTQKGCSL